MTSKSSPRRSASKGESAEASAPLKRFYFPTVDNGVTITAASQEEADEKLAALRAHLDSKEVPAEDSSQE